MKNEQERAVMPAFKIIVSLGVRVVNFMKFLFNEKFLGFLEFMHEHKIKYLRF